MPPHQHQDVFCEGPSSSARDSGEVQHASHDKRMKSSKARSSLSARPTTRRHPRARLPNATGGQPAAGNRPRPTIASRTICGSFGRVGYTAPSLVFAGPDGQRLEAGGFHPLEAYDVIANLDPTLARRPPATDPVEVLSAFPYQLTTAEVAAVMAEHLSVPDSAGAEAALITATGQGRVVRRPVADGSLWALAPDPPDVA